MAMLIGKKWFERRVASNATLASYWTYDNFLLTRAQQAVTEDNVRTRQAAECYVADELRQCLGDLSRTVQHDLIEMIVWYAKNH